MEEILRTLSKSTNTVKKYSTASTMYALFRRCFLMLLYYYHDFESILLLRYLEYIGKKQQINSESKRNDVTTENLTDPSQWKCVFSFLCPLKCQTLTTLTYICAKFVTREVFSHSSTKGAAVKSFVCKETWKLPAQNNRQLFTLCKSVPAKS